MKRRAYNFMSCTTIRVIRHKVGTLNIVTGAMGPFVDQGEETRFCDTPLFGDDHQLGLCKGCRKGFTHPENRLATAEEQVAFLAAIRPSHGQCRDNWKNGEAIYACACLAHPVEGLRDIHKKCPDYRKEDPDYVCHCLEKP